MSALSKKVAELVAESGLSLAEAGRKISVRDRYLSQVVNGTISSVSWEVASKLEVLFRQTPGTLTGLIDDPDGGAGAMNLPVVTTDGGGEQRLHVHRLFTGDCAAIRVEPMRHRIAPAWKVSVGDYLIVRRFPSVKDGEPAVVVYPSGNVTIVELDTGSLKPGTTVLGKYVGLIRPPV